MGWGFAESVTIVNNVVAEREEEEYRPVKVSSLCSLLDPVSFLYYISLSLALIYLELLVLQWDTPEEAGNVFRQRIEMDCTISNHYVEQLFYYNAIQERENERKKVPMWVLTL